MADCSQVANWDRTICDSTAIFARQLTSEWTREKTPYKLAEALETARSAPAQYTERIFLDSGFSAWLAYFLATTGHARHYKGQQAELETIAAFEQLSTEQRRTVATTLVNTAAHPTVVSAIEQLSNRYKRRRELPRGSYTSVFNLVRQGSTAPNNHHSLHPQARPPRSCDPQARYKAARRKAARQRIFNRSPILL